MRQFGSFISRVRMLNLVCELYLQYNFNVSLNWNAFCHLHLRTIPITEMQLHMWTPVYVLQTFSCTVLHNET